MLTYSPSDRLSSALVSHRSKAYVPALDGLRGIAAVSVLLNHLALTFASLAGTDLKPISIWSLMDHWGHNAVILFFCLSGFVLQRTFDTGRRQSLLRYLLKRAFRLLPTLFFVIAAVILAMATIRPHGTEAITAVLNNPLSADISTRTITRHFLLLGIRPSDVGLDPPMWSLVYEWRFSLVFPFMAAFCSTRPSGFLLAMFLCYVVAMGLCSSMGMGWPYIYGFGYRSSFYLTLQYLAFFGFGMALSTFNLRAAERWTSTAVEAGMVAAGLAVFSLVHNQLVVAGFSVAVIAAILYGHRTQAFLERRSIKWLGDISYPLYLSHMPVLYFTLYLLKARIGTVPSVTAAIVLAFLSAWLLHKFVEIPANSLGRRLSVKGTLTDEGRQGVAGV